MVFPALLEELEDAIAHGTAERRAVILHKITDIFVAGAADYSNNQIELFDNVFVRLADAIENSARAALANRLAANPYAPTAISRHLASDDAANVAAPVLQHSRQIDNQTVLAAARSQTQRHLLAISQRDSIGEDVTDVLVERGERPVVLSTANNPTARFSNTGFTALVERSDGDDELAACVGLRRDIPRQHFLRLLVRASHAVRLKLETANPSMSGTIENAVSEAAGMILDQTGNEQKYSEASAKIEALRNAGRLKEDNLVAFAAAGLAEESIVAFATLCNLSIEPVEKAMSQDRAEAILILAKASGLSWPAVKAMLRMRAGARGISPGEIEQSHEIFLRLNPAIARKVVDFQSKRAQGARFRNIA
jgi:uncharacterized protein (DUF2336 family)